MPAKSAAQYKLMAAKCHGNTSAGPSKEVACEFVHKTPAKDRSTFSKSIRAKRKKE